MKKMYGGRRKDERIHRVSPQGMDEVMKDFIKEMRLTSGLNTRIIFNAWDEVSGAAAWTTNRFFRDGILYINLSSSMVRSRLSFKLPEIMKAVNDRALADPLFVRDDPRTHLVTRIVLK